MAAGRRLARFLSTQTTRVSPQTSSRNALPVVFVSSPLSSAQSLCVPSPLLPIRSLRRTARSSDIQRVWPQVFARRGYESYFFNLQSARRVEHLARLEDGASVPPSATVLTPDKQSSSRRSRRRMWRFLL